MAAYDPNWASVLVQFAYSRTSLIPTPEPGRTEPSVRIGEVSLLEGSVYWRGVRIREVSVLDCSVAVLVSL